MLMMISRYRGPTSTLSILRSYRPNAELICHCRFPFTVTFTGSWHMECLLKLTWWTIGTLLLTNLFTIYIHFSHTPAGVIITSPTLLYLPSNPLQPCSIACVSFQIIASVTANGLDSNNRHTKMMS